jgi:hypothetical protein
MATKFKMALETYIFLAKKYPSEESSGEESSGWRMLRRRISAPGEFFSSEEFSGEKFS